MSDMKLCKNCKHSRNAYYMGITPMLGCQHPRFTTAPDPVYGVVSEPIMDCTAERDSGDCGRDARYYEPKPLPEPTWLERIFG